MKTQLYNEILSTINSFKRVDIECVEILEQKFPKVKPGTLSSIFSTEVQKWTKHKFSKAQDSANELYKRYKSAVDSGSRTGIIIRLSDEFEIPYSLTAKIILTKHYAETLGNGQSDVQCMASAKKALRDTTTIKDKKLAYEVYMCTIYDDQYSPTSEVIRMCLGQQYEVKLYKQLEKRGIVYRDEEYMRKLGFDKTPDVKLEIPIAADNFIIHWIESKARFGDFEVHKDYLKAQYTSYWNRFGPGLIIYWFGHLEDLDDPDEKRFIIRDRLPTNILKLAELMK